MEKWVPLEGTPNPDLAPFSEKNDQKSREHAEAGKATMPSGGKMGGEDKGKRC